VDKVGGAGYNERAPRAMRGPEAFGMKTLIFLLVLGGGVYLMYNFLQQKKAEAKQEEANAAVRYAKNLKADEDKAQQAVDKANAIIHAQDRQSKEATDAP
jgi:predicted negative regulator of RcsB-dependent stress response